MSVLKLSQVVGPAHDGPGLGGVARRAATHQSRFCITPSGQGFTLGNSRRVDRLCKIERNLTRYRLQIEVFLDTTPLHR